MPFIHEPTFDLKTIVKGISIALLVGIGIWYGMFQARHFIEGPQITLSSQPSVVQNETIVTIAGKADNITYLSLNGHQIYTDEEGFFERKLVLENGYTIMTLYARDRFGRSTSLSRPFVYVPASTIN